MEKIILMSTFVLLCFAVIAKADYKDELNTLSTRMQDIAQMMTKTQPRNAAGYSNMIARLEKVPEVIDQTITWMRK